jgi:hypothetical protein
MTDNTQSSNAMPKTENTEEKWGGDPNATEVRIDLKLPSGKVVEYVLPNRKDPSEWKIRRDQVFRPDKRAYVYNKFRLEFPDIKIDDDISIGYNLICRLVNRSKFLSLWLQTTNLMYANIVAIPSYLEGQASPEEFKDAVDKVKFINNASVDMVKKNAAALDIYKKALAKNKEEYEKLVNIKNCSNAVKVMTLDSSLLPISLINEIENYTFNKELQPSREAYAREIVINFKTFLYKTAKQENIDVFTLVDALSTK